MLTIKGGVRLGPERRKDITYDGEYEKIRVSSIIPLASMMVYSNSEGRYYFMGYDKLVALKNENESIFDQSLEICCLNNLTNKENLVVQANFLLPDVSLVGCNSDIYLMMFENEAFLFHHEKHCLPILQLGVFGSQLLYVDNNYDAYLKPFRPALTHPTYKSDALLVANEKGNRIKVVQISCGRSHAIVLDDSGTVYTVGDNSKGQLGVGMSVKNSPTFVQVTELGWTKCKKVAAGGWHNLVVNESGHVYSWGWNLNGQLGVQSIDISEFPTSIERDENNSVFENIVDISCGCSHSAALSANGQAYLWGSNQFNEIATTDTKRFSSPVVLKGTKSSVRCGHLSTIVVSIKPEGQNTTDE
uniref:Probable E3 ubiquitin-protein ligase HERC4 n=1 Tax=Salmo salar TaxID=8030 RepID=B5XC60_SALSA|nr:probable E3 ubiquitin-protein ligase HERC4 [Salmo salar]ACI68430.1 Probable E3 ubiquitin-protein ligase HERC4 [Salmo salar]